MNLSRFFRLVSGTIGALLVGVVFSLTGCQPAGQDDLSLLDAQASEIKIDDLSRTMDFVLSEKRFQQREFVDKVSTGLNRWLSTNRDRFADDDWQLDGLVKPLVDEYAELALVRDTEQLEFKNDDALFLNQQSWFQKLSGRLIASDQLSQLEIYRLAASNFRPAEDAKNPLADVIKVLHADLADQDAEDLVKGLKLFDWVVRNIQMLPETSIAAEEVDELRLNDNPSENLGWAGVQSTGAIRHPWQVLLYSRGDYVERAKLFMALAHQVGIDSVLLATKSETGSTPWCVGLLIGNETPRVYLFDTKLGLPVPGGKPGSIATLAEVRSDPKLLDWLDLTLDESLADETSYWVKGDAIQDLEALVYCSPEGCSRRMNRLERSLTGEYRMRLTHSPSKIASRLQGISGLTPRIWNVEFQTHVFRAAVRDAKTRTFDDELQPKLAWHFLNEAYIDEFPLYRTARSKYFSGNFESERNAIAKNAIEDFYSLIYSDKTIDTLGTDELLQRRLGITKDEGLTVLEFQNRLDIVKGQMGLVRRDAGFFLSECHFDNNNPGAAATWLNKIKDDSGVASAERWRDAVNYLLGRAYETRNQYDEAIAIYREQKESTQVHGNLIRARILSSLAEKLIQP